MKQAQIRRLSEFILIEACIICLCCCYVYSQSTTVSVHGVATDSSGAVISGAKIKLICRCNECPNRPCSECCPSGFSASATSGEDGRFSLNNVPPGVYFLTGEAAGFKDVEVHRVDVNTSASRSIELVFNPGETEGGDSQYSKTGELLMSFVNRESKKPLENAKVTLLWQCECKKECPTKPCSECCPSERVLYATTDASGVIRFNGPPGTYLIDTAFGAYSKETLVHLKKGEKEQVKIALTLNERSND